MREGDHYQSSEAGVDLTVPAVFGPTLSGPAGRGRSMSARRSWRRSTPISLKPDLRSLETLDNPKRVPWPDRRFPSELRAPLLRGEVPKGEDGCGRNHPRCLRTACET